MKNLVCPISTEKTDSNVSRLTIFLNVILMAFFLVTLNPIYIIVVAIDYFIRATLKAKYSPFRFIAYKGIEILDLKKKPIGLAQKIFAARLGFVCAFSSAVLVLLNYNIASISVAGLLITLSFIDSVFSFCIGCVVYNYLVYPFYKDK